VEPHFVALEARPGPARIDVCPAATSRTTTTASGLSQSKVRCGYSPLVTFAAALRRTRWTVLRWERMKLLPPAPFVMNPHQHRGKRRLYPDDYVKELGRFTAKHYPGPRLERESWVRCQEQVYEVYNRLVMPHLGGCYSPVQIEVDAGQGPCMANRDPVPYFPFAAARSTSAVSSKRSRRARSLAWKHRPMTW
jgi:hypothetical protein